MSLRWGILATGTIGKTFAKALIGSSNNSLVAVGSRSLDSAQAFAENFPDIELTCHGS